MAQLVARLNGIQKVRGSNPLSSTKLKREVISLSFFLCSHTAKLAGTLVALLLR